MNPAPDWHSALLAPDATLQSAIRTLDECALRILLVAGPDRRLVGTITDGDIRRGLLRGLGLDDPVEGVVNRTPFVAPTGMERALVTHLMRVNRILQLPVVDGEGRLVGLHTWDALDLPARRENTMVIMAGGLGTRLRPHTEECPKPMLKVGDRPILEHIILHARAQGITRFVLAVRYLGHLIEQHFGNGQGLQVDIDYVREDVPLGTAGALGLVAGTTTAPLIVANGDVLSTIRFDEMLDYHAAQKASATMAVRMHEWQHPFGVVRMDGIDIAGFEEKPVTRTQVNAGVYVLSPDALSALRKGERCDMPDLFMRVRAAGQRIVAYPIHENWVDVGRPSDLELARGGNPPAG